MPKIYKLTESQVVVLRNHIKSDKKLNEDISVPDALSTAAKGYYTQSGTQPKIEDEEISEEVPPQDPAEDKKIKDALLALNLQVIPGTPASTQPPTAAVGSTQALQAQSANVDTQAASGQPGVIGEVEPVSNSKPDSMSGDLSFKTPVEISFSDSNGLRIYCDKNGIVIPVGEDIEVVGTLLVEWSINLDKREWGVKSIDVDVDNITGVLNFSYVDIHNKTRSFDKDFNFSEWTVNLEDMMIDKSIRIYSLDLDWREMSANIG